MEVHHHAHTPRKKWTHYFWEFLMLFLAVFCGFLAEYKLEHVIELQREEKYAISLLEDLKKDTADLNNDLLWWELQAKRIDTIHIEFDKPEADRNLFSLYRMVSFMRIYNAFEYHDRTIDQLKNAGFFRLLRQKNVADSLIDYDALVRSTLLNIEGGSNSIFMNVNFLQDKIFDTRYMFVGFRSNISLLDSLFRANPATFSLRAGKKEEIFEYANHLQFYKGNVLVRQAIMRSLLHKAKTLIELIKTEYRLE
jgi:hypothetical protein